MRKGSGCYSKPPHARGGKADLDNNLWVFSLSSTLEDACPLCLGRRCSPSAGMDAGSHAAVPMHGGRLPVSPPPSRACSRSGRVRHQCCAFVRGISNPCLVFVARSAAESTLSVVDRRQRRLAWGRCAACSAARKAGLRSAHGTSVRHFMSVSFG